ncbi:MAG: type 4a pilus biogenesis protein PilO [Sedimentisphaerales bacterium]|nr:type 4a pilus biogenesis protein PilO [Sedimentisphaerales bacterium]
MQICEKPKIFDVDFFGLAAAIAVCTLTWLLVIQPINKKIDQELNQQNQFIQEHNSAQARYESLQNLVQRRRQLAENLQQTRDVLRDSADIPEVIQKINALTCQNNLQLNEVTPATEINTEHFRKTEISFRLQGNYPDLKEFLQNLSESMQFVRVSSLKINSEMNNEENLCAIDIKLNVFAPL